MARFPRVVVPGHRLHVIQRGNNRQAIFFAEQDYHRFHNDLREASQRFDYVIHAYVYMTNHVHLLVTPGSSQGISRMMQSIGRRYVRYIIAFMFVAAPCGRGTSSRLLLIQTNTCLQIMLN